jgi:hypothetical protein
MDCVVFINCRIVFDRNNYFFNVDMKGRVYTAVLLWFSVVTCKSDNELIFV